MLIKPFSKIGKKDAAIAGGKGASLGEMTQAGLKVPPGFVILAEAFDRFLEETDLMQELEAQLKQVNYQDINSVDGASSRIRALIANVKMPADLAKDIVSEFKKLKSPLVAVRSSATAEDSLAASWAGELETYLNTTDKTLLGNVKKCWSSLFTPRAIFYRQEKKMLKTKVSVAVVIQKMVDSEISGIAFTVHPVTQDRNQMIIEAGYGLGEAIVSGSVTPDSYVLEKKELNIVDINISEQERKIIKGANGGIKWVPVLKSAQAKQKLSGKQIIELAKICLAIEKHYKFPCDIEWAQGKGKFYITQSRPITTL
ncbi:MAG TPA: PEP/pyruvate-binding domain-containing protein [Candidatus Saccharimonadales bacterium]|nr:PEP/pyruvate-binding domain-containing protein [Candidatus Saccharimonadales bacterium]